MCFCRSFLIWPFFLSVSLLNALFFLLHLFLALHTRSQRLLLLLLLLNTSNFVCWHLGNSNSEMESFVDFGCVRKRYRKGAAFIDYRIHIIFLCFDPCCREKGGIVSFFWRLCSCFPFFFLCFSNHCRAHFFFTLGGRNSDALAFFLRVVFSCRIRAVLRVFVARPIEETGNNDLAKGMYNGQVTLLRHTTCINTRPSSRVAVYPFWHFFFPVVPHREHRGLISFFFFLFFLSLSPFGSLIFDVTASFSFFPLHPLFHSTSPLYSQAHCPYDYVTSLSFLSSVLICNYQSWKKLQYAPSFSRCALHSPPKQRSERVDVCVCALVCW